MGDADTVKIQSLIKRVVETTRCSTTQAELALYDNDNNVFAAVEHILDQGDEFDAWTEQKSRKDKKKEEEEKKDPRGFRGQSSGRGRGGDRGSRGRGSEGRGGSTSQHRGGPPRGGGAVRGGRGQSAAARQTGRLQAETGVLKSVDLNEDTSDWKSGPLEFKRSENAVPSSSATAAPVSNTSSSAPISFAAVAAAGAAKKEQQKQPTPPAPVAELPREPTPELVHAEESFTSEPSVANSKLDHEDVPVNKEEPVNVVSVHSVQATPPQLQANVTWTTQLKSDLGIGVPMATDVSPTKPQYQVAPATLLPAGVEFANEPANAGLGDYHFGFVEAPPVVPQPPPPVEPTHVTPAELFASTRHSTTTQVTPLKAAQEPIHSSLSNGDYPLRTTSPPSAASSLPQNRLGFADASTVSYNPPSTDSRNSQNVPKQSSHSMGIQPQAHAQQQQHQPQQQTMFASQMPFSYPNPYAMSIPSMYSPVTGMRPEDQAYASLLAQYPFNMTGMTDMTNLMSGAAFPQTSSSQSLSSQHRTDSHGKDNNMMFSTQSTRDQNQQPSGVQPPPGFATSHFGMQPQLGMLAHQQYNPSLHHNYAQFMMPNIGTGGRQVYSQEEDRSKSYDKMSGVKSQQSQPQTYHNGQHYGMGGGNSTKKNQYNWANN